MIMRPASSHFWCVVTISAFALGVWPAAAQEADTPPSGQALVSDGKAKPTKKTTKTQADSKSAKSAGAKPKAGQFASEAEAKAKCRGTVVWVDQDHLNHYEGSREYGVKPGAFACE